MKQSVFKAVYSAARKSMQGNTVYCVTRNVADDGRVYFDLRTKNPIDLPINSFMHADMVQVLGMKYAKPIKSATEIFADRAADGEFDEEDDDYIVD